MVSKLVSKCYGIWVICYRWHMDITINEMTIMRFDLDGRCCHYKKER